MTYNKNLSHPSRRKLKVLYFLLLLSLKKQEQPEEKWVLSALITLLLALKTTSLCSSCTHIHSFPLSPFPSPSPFPFSPSSLQDFSEWDLCITSGTQNDFSDYTDEMLLLERIVEKDLTSYQIHDVIDTTA